MKKNYLLVLLFLLIIFKNLFAQSPDQRAESIQNGTFNTFMSADQSYYYGNNNRNNDPYGYGYWVTAHTLETLADAYQRTRNTVYKNRMKSIIAGIRKYNLYAAGTYHNDYYDDLEWLALATFDCYNATKDPEFLDAVHQIWSEIKTGYSNGKMSWRKGCTTPCNNSIANGPAIILAVKLYQLEGDNTNLQMAKDIHAWMKANVLNADGGIWDGPDNHNPDWQFSYNSGMFIGACLELSLVTGQQSYIDDGIKAAEFMMNFRNYSGGVFFLNEKGQGDGGLFKGIFAKWFTEFVRVGNLSQLYKDRYLRVINYTADFAWANSVNKSNYLISPDWSALPNGTIDLSTQTSGVHLFEAAASLGKVHVYQDINYGGFYSQLPIGSYTLAQLQAKGVVDNDITSFTIPTGYSITVYENDNFLGASKTFTGNTAWLADWNDRISSVKISDNRTYAVTAFQDINYGGYSAGLDVGNYTLAQLQSRGILDNDITSFKVSPGFKVTVYDGDNFTGTSAEYTSDVNWLADWNDKISSIKVIDIRPYPVTVYQDVNYGGYSVGLDVGEYTLIQLQSKGVLNNDITSLKVAPGYRVTLYDGDNFTGTSIDFTADNGWLADWNDKATSLRISKTTTNQSPSISITSPANNASYDAPASITINANANDSDGTIAKVEFFNGSTLLGSDNSSPYSFVWSNVTVGTYAITAKATDNLGASTITGGVTIKVNSVVTNQAPSATITSPSNNSSFNAPASVTINANASDADGTISKVEFFNGNTLLGTDNSSPYSFIWSNVGAGTYTVTAKATDNSGAVATSSVITIKVNSVVSNQAPTVTITSPSNNASFNAPASVTINANASDSDGSISKVEFYNGSTLIGSDNSSPYSVTWTNVAAGSYSLTAKATDNSGTVTTSSLVPITVKTVTTNTCSGVSKYAENSGYVAGSIVQNAGRRYECKEWPYSGWCNGAAWAYAPGTGSYWTDAWYDRGTCSAKTSVNSDNESESQLGFSIVPNPVQSEMRVVTEMDLTGGQIQIVNALGIIVLESSNPQQNLDVTSLTSGVYTLVFTRGDTRIVKQFIK